MYMQTFPIAYVNLFMTFKGSDMLKIFWIRGYMVRSSWVRKSWCISGWNDICNECSWRSCEGRSMPWRWMRPCPHIVRKLSIGNLIAMPWMLTIGITIERWRLEQMIEPMLAVQGWMSKPRANLALDIRVGSPPSSTSTTTIVSIAMKPLVIKLNILR